MNLGDGHFDQVLGHSRLSCGGLRLARAWGGDSTRGQEGVSTVECLILWGDILFIIYELAPTFILSPHTLSENVT